MFSNLISTICVCAILQAIVNLIIPENKLKSTLISTTNIIFMAIIFTKVVEIINNFP